MDATLVEKLHKATLEAAKLIGYSEVFFENLPDNRFDSVNLLDIVKSVEHYLGDIRPDIVYTHHYGDLNIDHRLACEAVLTATRPTKACTVKEVYEFETVSSTEWSFGNREWGFFPNVFVDIQDYFEIKCDAMKKYKSELCSFPHPRSLETLEALAKKRGSIAGKEYAEAFELARRIV